MFHMFCEAQKMSPRVIIEISLEQVIIDQIRKEEKEWPSDED